MEEIRHKYHSQLYKLGQEILKMGTRVEETLKNSVNALVNKDIETAQKIKDSDSEIDNKTAEIEDRCAILIATEQPVAQDMRHIITALKIVSDIERIGDHAVHLARITIELKDEKYIKPLINIPRMAEIGTDMLHNVLTAYTEGDTDEARNIASKDKEIDKLYEQSVRELMTYMMENPKTIEQGMKLLFICRWMERLGDHVVNICERIIFDYEGKHVELNP